MRLTRAICLLALTIYSPMANAADGDRPIPSEVVALLSQTEPTPLFASAEPPEAKKFHGFFGYLEFDFDPDVGGVPAFGNCLFEREFGASPSRHVRRLTHSRAALMVGFRSQ
jgi:hypothetical protein